MQDLYSYQQKAEQNREQERRWRDRLNAWAESDMATFLSMLRDQANRFNSRAENTFLRLTVSPESSAHAGSVTLGDSRFDYQLEQDVLTVNFVGNLVASWAYDFTLKLYEGDLESFKNIMTGTPTFVRGTYAHSVLWKSRRSRNQQPISCSQLALECLKKLIDNSLQNNS